MTICKNCGKTMVIISHHQDILLYSDGNQTSYFYYCEHCGSLLHKADNIDEWIIPEMTNLLSKNKL